MFQERFLCMIFLKLSRHLTDDPISKEIFFSILEEKLRCCIKPGT